MPTPIDWQEIKAKFESGVSQHSLAKEYGIRQATISDHATKEGWQKFSRITPLLNRITDTPNSTDPIAIANQALVDLAKYLSHEPVTVRLTLIEHKLFADSFSQYIKAKLLLPSDKPTASGIAAELLPYLNLDQLNHISDLQNQIDTILEEAQAKKLEAEQGIKTIKKAM